MSRKYTEDELLQFAYNELGSDDIDALRKQMLNDEALLKRFKEIFELKLALDKLAYVPSQSSVDIILEHSASSPSLPDHSLTH